MRPKPARLGAALGVLLLATLVPAPPATAWDESAPEAVRYARGNLLITRLSPDVTDLRDIAVVNDANLVYASDSPFNYVGRFASDVARKPIYIGRFNRPAKIATDSDGNAYTANESGTITKVTPSGQVVPVWAQPSRSAVDLAVDPSNNVFVLDEVGQLFKLNPRGQTVASYATGASMPESEERPGVLAVAPKGDAFTLNASSGVITKVSASGVVTDKFATVPPSASEDFFWWVSTADRDMAIDANGTIYVTNRESSTVSRVTESGAVTATFAALAPGSEPTGIAVTRSGSIVTADPGSSAVSLISATGRVTSPYIAFRPSDTDRDNESFSSPGFPTEVEVTPTGALYVANSSDIASILKVAPHVRRKAQLDGTISQSIRLRWVVELPSETTGQTWIRWSSLTPSSCMVDNDWRREGFPVVQGKRAGRCVIRAVARKDLLYRAMSRTFTIKVRK